MNFLLAAGAIIEIGTGLGALTFPEQLVTLLLNEQVTGTDIFLARVFGTAIVALGMTWWVASKEPEGRGIRTCAPGFVAYNLGAAVVLTLQALATTQSVPLLWPLAVLHAGLSLGFVTLLLKWKYNSRRRDEP